MTTPTTSMLHVSFEPYRLTLHESVGLAHETQVVEIPVPESASGNFYLRDESTRRLFPVQASERRPGRGYILLSLAPEQTLKLVPARARNAPEFPPVGVKSKRDVWTVSNGQFSIELSAGRQEFGADRSKPVLGPIRRFRTESEGAWRGRTFFDTLNAPVREKASWLEKGPLRCVYQYRIDFAGGGFYELEVTIDASSDFARCHETFRSDASDQIVWDFAGADLPERINLLDSGAGHTPRWLHYHLDQRQARLWCWTQFSQLHDLSDGFSLRFSGADDAVGLVALAGGKWSGNALNHLEAWTRRWETAVPATRRLPGETKADSFPGIDAIPARGQSVNAAHFTLEGWLRHGERHFALVLSTGDKLAPACEREGTSDAAALGHFEDVPRRDLYPRVQGRLRKIHIQHGLLPLQDQLGLTFEWPLEKSLATPGAPLSKAQQHAHAVSRYHHAKPAADDPDCVRLIDHFLAARVYGFWEGSGAAYTNCVVSRRVGPDMLHFEALVKEGKLDAKQIARWRAWFSFLAHLYHADNFYPGPSTMEPIGAPNSVEPTMAGMSNQNFYTDILTLPAFAAQVFPSHPSAAGWREKFLVNWHRQLEYHVFPRSGVWEESHTYYQHVLVTVLPLFLRRAADGTRDDFADVAFQKMVAGAVPQLTPPNAVVGECRHLVTFGDHGAEPLRYRYVYRELALALHPHAPALAQHLAWVNREMKGDDLPDIAPQAPTLATGYLEGLGFFFRGTAGSECLLALRSGMAWGHHHNDDGSIQFYARGRALISDSGSSQPQERGERKAQSAGHSRTVADGIEPLNHLWRFNRGWILEAQTEGALPYAVAGTPTFTTMPRSLPAVPLARALWELRAVIELAPAVYLIADYLDASHRHTVRFHVANQEVGLEGNRVLASFGASCRLKIVPLFEVNPPALSIDRPSDPAKQDRETTTAVEYGAVTGPWALFIIAALEATERLEVAKVADKVWVSLGKRNLEVRRSETRLDVSVEGVPQAVAVDAPPLLAKLRAASR